MQIVEPQYLLHRVIEPSGDRAIRKKHELHMNQSPDDPMTRFL